MADSITPVAAPVTAPVKAAAPEVKNGDKTPEIIGTVATAAPAAAPKADGIGAGVDKSTPTDKQAKKLYMMA